MILEHKKQIYPSRIGRQEDRIMPTSIIPQIPGATPSYFCTWALQNYLVHSSGAYDVNDHGAMSDTLTEKNLAQYIHNTDFLSRVRKDLIFMLDVGWDIPLGVKFAGDMGLMGSMIVAEDKFPSCTGNPAQRLRKLNEAVKAAGWKGTGIWVPANIHGDSGAAPMLQERVREFYSQRLEWSHDAGILYWKVDYGLHGGPGFREIITRLAEKIAPGLGAVRILINIHNNEYL